MGYYVPSTLKTRPNWLVWRFEDRGNTKPSKVPYSPKTKHGASVTNCKHWVSYDEALNYFQYGGEYDGLGYVFTEESGLVFIDIDNCIADNGEESPLAAELQELFKGTYIELSQSEKGLHIICKGEIPNPTGNKRDDIGLEIYADKRYIAFTGNAINIVEPTDQQNAINAVFSKYFPKATQEPQDQQKQAETGNFEGCIEDKIIIIRASKQGAKFEALHNGKWAGIYSSQSEADQAYINIVNYFTGGNDELTKEIWRDSELSKRPKGKRIDYIQGMIRKAKISATECRTSGYKSGYAKTRVKTAEVDNTPVKKRVRVRM